MRHPKTSNAVHRGLTLLEVVLAMTVLSIAMAFLYQLVGMGIRASKEARLLTQGQLLGESLVTEIVSGSIPPGESGATVPNDPNWQYWSQTNPTNQLGVVQLVVTLQNSNDNLAKVITFSRLMRDPNEPIPEETATTDDTSSSSATSTDTGGTSL